MNVTQDEYAGMAGDARYLQVPVAEGKRDKAGLVRHLPAALRFVEGLANTAPRGAEAVAG